MNKALYISFLASILVNGFFIGAVFMLSVISKQDSLQAPVLPLKSPFEVCADHCKDNECLKLCIDMVKGGGKLL